MFTLNKQRAPITNESKAKSYRYKTVFKVIIDILYIIIDVLYYRYRTVCKVCIQLLKKSIC